jgi:hypothetical protein
MLGAMNIIFFIFLSMLTDSMHRHGARTILFYFKGWITLISAIDSRSTLRTLSCICEDVAGPLEIYSVIRSDKLRNVFSHIINLG